MPSITVIGTLASLIAAIFAILNYQKGHQPSINIDLRTEPGYDEFPERFRINYSNSSSNPCSIQIHGSVHISVITIKINQSEHFAGPGDNRDIHVDLSKNDAQLNLTNLHQMPVTVEISCSYDLFHLIGAAWGVTETYHYTWNPPLKAWANKSRISARYYIKAFGGRSYW